MSIREKLYSRGRGFRARRIPSASPEIADPAHSSHPRHPPVLQKRRHGPELLSASGTTCNNQALTVLRDGEWLVYEMARGQLYFRAERGEQHGFCVALSRGSILSVHVPPGSTRTYCLTYRAQRTVLRGRPDCLTSLLRYGKAMSHGRTHTKLRRVLCVRALPAANPLTWKS